MSTSDIDAENLCAPNPAVQTINAISSRHNLESLSLSVFFLFFVEKNKHKICKSSATGIN